MPLALTDQGLTIETVEECRAGLDTSMKNVFGPQIKTHDGAALGQINGILAERLVTIQEGLQAVHSSQDPDKATGAALAALCALTGTTPLGATHSTVTLTLIGDDTTVVAEGSRASVVETGEEFETDEDATLEPLDAWAAATAYVATDLVTNDGGNAYVVTSPGTSAGSGGPTGEGTAITDGSVVWRFIGAGAAFAQVAGSAVETGPTIATTYAITDIVTPVAGWSNVVNLADAVPGRNDETDEDLRVRREVELQSPGTGPQNAIRTDLSKVTVGSDKPTAVRVFMNNTDATDADGVPPHSVEALVSCPDTAEWDQAIFDQLIRSVAAGIRTHGDVVGTSVDAEGISQTMKFSRPTEIPIYVAITYTYDAELIPADHEDQVIAAIVAFGVAQVSGKNAVSSSTGAQAFKVTGVNDVVTCYIGTSPSPVSSATIAIALREIAVFSTANITVSSSAATP